MDSPNSKADTIPTICSHILPQEAPSRYLPFLEAGFWPGTTPLSPFFVGPMNREVPPFWPVPWLPQLWSPSQTSKTASRPVLPPSAATSPSPEGSQVTNGSASENEVIASYRTSSLNSSPAVNGSPHLSLHRARAPPIVDPILALTSIEASPVISRALASTLPRRPRSEKRPIPEEQKDDKYFERRKRNNMAAKKSRDARKAREDEIALRACFLEKENAILRAQVTTLREEAQSLRQLLLQKRHSEWCKT
ncbi:D site-binding protein-like [Uloborus diversus]|uniref:D site-binding protein-like n=1 Tax=Uloborus diversus TaxID=327109 RepID=UPI002409B949|nr:D site-binding protein-like [Uloborus diversus]